MVGLVEKDIDGAGYVGETEPPSPCAGFQPFAVLSGADICSGEGRQVSGSFLEEEGADLSVSNHFAK